MGKHNHSMMAVERDDNKAFSVVTYRCRICGKFFREPTVKRFEDCKGITYEEYIQDLSENGLEEPF